MVEEEEKETIIKLATPDKGSVMPPANYKIGVLAQPHQYQKGAAETVGETIGSKVGEAALVGGGPEGTFFEKGLWGKMQPGFSKFFGGAPAAASSLPVGTIAGPIQGLAGTKAVAGASAATPGMMAGLASNPLGWAVLGGLALRKLFRNKGGAVGPLSPQYHRHGDEVEVPIPRPRPMTYGEAYDKAYEDRSSNFLRRISSPWLPQWINYMKPKGLEFPKYYPQSFPNVSLNAKIKQLMYNKKMREAGVPGFNQGGNVQHKEHGGMTGPLSNNKSVKMEKKETIEYKN